MANPKRKVSRSKRDMRRSHWLNSVPVPSLTECVNCGETKLPHHACPECGYYKGQKIIGTEE